MTLLDAMAKEKQLRVRDEKEPTRIGMRIILDFGCQTALGAATAEEEMAEASD